MPEPLNHIRQFLQDRGTDRGQLGDPTDCVEESCENGPVKTVEENMESTEEPNATEPTALELFDLVKQVFIHYISK